MAGDSITSVAYSSTAYWWKDIRTSVDAQASVTWIDSGVPSETAAYFAANVQTKVIDHAPQVLIFMIGVNDAFTNVTATAFRTSLDAFLNACLSALPGLRVMLAGPWINGGARPSGSNSDDGDMDAIRGQMRSCAASRHLPYVDFRALYFADSVTGLTADGVHPNTAGMQWLSGHGRALIDVVP